MEPDLLELVGRREPWTRWPYSQEQNDSFDASLDTLARKGEESPVQSFRPFHPEMLHMNSPRISRSILENAQRQFHQSMARGQMDQIVEHEDQTQQSEEMAESAERQTENSDSQEKTKEWLGSSGPWDDDRMASSFGRAESPV